MAAKPAARSSGGFQSGQAIVLTPNEPEELRDAGLTIVECIGLDRGDHDEMVEFLRMLGLKEPDTRPRPAAVSDAQGPNRAKEEHCKWGHVFDEKNTRIRKATGYRDCRRCGWLRKKAQRAGRPIDMRTGEFLD